MYRKSVLPSVRFIFLLTTIDYESVLKTEIKKISQQVNPLKTSSKISGIGRNFPPSIQYQLYEKHFYLPWKPYPRFLTAEPTQSISPEEP
jgi:hypothetical protein